MKPVELEIIMRDSTRQGMQSVNSNMVTLEKQVERQLLLIQALEKVLKEMQVQFAQSTKTVADQSENTAMIDLLKKEIDELKVKLAELKNQNENTTLVPPMLPKATRQFNGLGMSIQQVARELPSLTMGANMFFLAISNNLPILADNLKVARTEYAALTAQGQKATPVWKQVVSSIFSWQTAMVVGITLLTVYGKEIGNWIKGLFKGKEALKSISEVQSDVNKKMFESSTGVGSQIVVLRKLQEQWKKLGGEINSQKKFITENQSAFDDLKVSINSVKDAESLLVGNTENFIKALKLRAQATAAQKLAAEKYEESFAADRKGELEAAKEMTLGDVVNAGVGTYSMETFFENFERRKNKVIAGYKEEAKAAEAAGDAYFDFGQQKSKESNDLLEKLNLTIIPKKPTENSEESLTDDLSSAELKALQKIEAMKIAIMREGAAKEKAESRARFDAELARIDQEEKERLNALVKAKKNGLPVSKEQVTAVTDQSGAQRKLASETYVKEFLGIEKEYADVEQKKFDELVGKHQDYTARRVSIEKKFNDDIAILQAERDKAQQSGDTAKVDQLNRAVSQATANKGKELIGLDYEQLKETPEYVRAFENLKETSSDTLDSLLSQLENAKSAAAQVLSPDQLREYTTTIQEIMDELDSRNPFGALADRKAELAEAEMELAKAQQQLNAVQGGAQIVTGVKNTKLNKDTGKIDSEKTYLTTAKAMEKYNKAQDNVAKKGAKVEKAEKEVDDVMNELFGSIKDVGDAIGGPAGEIIGLIGDIGLFAMTAMSGVSTASTTASKSIQAVEKASVILAIIGAAIQIAMKIASLFKDDDGVAAYEKAKGVYESYIDILDRVIEKQKELFELNSKVGEQAYETAKETVRKQEDASRDLGKQYLNSGASKGFLGIGSSASEGVKQRDEMSSKALAEAQKVLGRDYKKATDGRMTGLFDLSAKQLADLQRDAPLFWAELHDDTQKYLQQIVDCGDELNQLEKDRNEGLTKIDFDSFYSGFLDTLSDMDASSEDFANSFEDYLKNAILSSLITNEYKSRIQALYNNWASSAKSGNKLTEEEIEVLRKEQESISEDMLKKREELAKTFGWQSEAEKEQQAGKAGSFTTMNQDQGTKLEGLFTSVQGHVSNIDDLVRDINQAMYKAADMLAQIVVNTAYCRHLEQMATDIAEMKRDGLKMK